MGHRLDTPEPAEAAVPREWPGSPWVEAEDRPVILGAPGALVCRAGTPADPASPATLRARDGPGRSPDADNGPADTHTPTGAVRAFLNALKAKDRDKLNEATALRSQREAASERNRELFLKIVDLSISDAELDEIAKKLDGYKVAGENAVKSTGQQGVIIAKQTDDGGRLTPGRHSPQGEEGLGRDGHHRADRVQGHEREFPRRGPSLTLLPGRARCRPPIRAAGSLRHPGSLVLKKCPL